MARQGNIKLRGTFGDVEFYNWNDISCMRSKPKRIKQTAKTKASAKTFGKSSKVANKILPSINPVIPALVTRHARNLFVKAINKWLHTDPLNTAEPLNDLPFITGYQFNETTSLNDRLKLLLNVSRNADNTLTLNIPSFDPVKAISAPANTIAVQLCIIACSCNVNDPSSVPEQTSAFIEIEYTNIEVAAQQITLQVHVAPGNLTVVMMALKYMINRKGNLFETEDKRWMPAGIVSGLYN